MELWQIIVSAIMGGIIGGIWLYKDHQKNKKKKEREADNAG